MAMGSTPCVLVLCLDDIIAIVHRSYGIILVFKYFVLNDNHTIKLLGRENVQKYVVDASICYKRNVEISAGSTVDDDDDDDKRIEVVLLLSDPNNSKDGNIGK